MIQNCYSSTMELLDEGSDDDEEELRIKKKSKKVDSTVKDKTYTLVSFNTLSGSITVLVTILEKVFDVDSDVVHPI